MTLTVREGTCPDCLGWGGSYTLCTCCNPPVPDGPWIECKTCKGRATLDDYDWEDK